MEWVSGNGMTRVSLQPCPPDEFAGRFSVRRKLDEILDLAPTQGRTVLITGLRGSGKSSILEWVENRLQVESDEDEKPVLKAVFLEPSGLIFTTYRELLLGLKSHQKVGWLREAVSRPVVQKSIDIVLSFLGAASEAIGPGKLVATPAIDAAREMIGTQINDDEQLIVKIREIIRNISDALPEGEFLAILLDDTHWASKRDFSLLKYLVQNPPPGIIYVLTFRLERDTYENFLEFQRELDRFANVEIHLYEMDVWEVKDFARKRYKVSIDDPTAEFLNRNVNDPFA